MTCRSYRYTGKKNRGGDKMNHFWTGLSIGLLWGVIADVFLLFIVLPQPDLRAGQEPAAWYQAVAPVGFALISVPFFAGLATYRLIAILVPDPGISDFAVVLTLCPMYGMLAGGFIGAGADRHSRRRAGRRTSPSLGKEERRTEVSRSLLEKAMTPFGGRVILFASITVVSGSWASASLTPRKTGFSGEVFLGNTPSGAANNPFITPGQSPHLYG